jgi:signal transduction histidine kinase
MGTTGDSKEGVRRGAPAVAAPSRLVGVPLALVLVALELAAPLYVLAHASRPLPLPLPLTVLDGLAVPAIFLCVDAVVRKRRPAYNATHRLGIGAPAAVVVSTALSSLAVRFGWLPPFDGRIPAWSGQTENILGGGSVVLMSAITSLLQVAIWTVAVYVPTALTEQRLQSEAILSLEKEAESLRTQAELNRLRSQLEPHFLLNTMNLISSLIGSDPDLARSAMGALGSLLRDSLDDRREVQTLGDELAWLHRYAEILSLRHGSFLAFVWNVDESLLEVRLPRLLLQPLVENAVLHGALRRAAGGCVTVEIERVSFARGTAVRCVVSDNGPGQPKSYESSNGIGIPNVRRRIELNYPGATFELKRSTAGTSAILHLPLTTSGSALDTTFHAAISPYPVERPLD